MSKRSGLVVSVMCVVSCLSLSAGVHAASSVYAPVTPFQAQDVLAPSFAGFDVTDGGKIIGLVGREIRQYSASGAFERLIGTVPKYNAGMWGTFLRLSPDESEVWVGYTIGTNTDDRIYSVPFSADNAAGSYRATLNGNFDLEWLGVGTQWKPVVSGLNSSNWSDPSSVWLLDTVANNHNLIATVGSYGSGIAFDSAGNLYASNYAQKKLYRFPAAAVQWAANDASGYLVTDNADFSTSIHGGGSDITVDAADRVYFNANGSSLVGLLRPELTGDYRYDNIAVGCGEWGNWTTYLAYGGGAGDATAGEGAVYVGDWYSLGGVTMLSVPEPATVALVSLGAGVLAASGRRNSRRSNILRRLLTGRFCGKGAGK